MAMDREEMLRLGIERVKRCFGEVDAPRKYRFQREVAYITLRDGVKLYAVITKPDAEGPFPTVLTRTAYPQMDALTDIYSEEYARRGFAYVLQHCRGVGKSEGKWEPNVNERNDGRDTLSWLEERDWVKNIGISGSSYLALTGWAVADVLTPKVKCLFLTQYGTDRFVSAYKSGLFRHDVLTSWAAENAGFETKAGYPEMLRHRPHIEADEAVLGGKLPWYREWITNTSYGDEYWSRGFWGLLKEIPTRVNVPVCIMEGWYDHHLGSALETWKALPESTRERSALRIGAWNHGFAPCVKGIACERLDNNEIKTGFEWFQSLLTGETQSKTGVSVYRIGRDKWEDGLKYPFETKREFVMQFERGRLSEALKDNSGAGGETVSFIYNPENPVTSYGAESMLFSTLTSVGSLPQPEPDYRDDVISFVSEPFNEALDILGKIRVALSVSSDAEDTAFTAKVMVVRADGAAYNIRGSIATLAYRNGDKTARAEYVPGEVTRLNIDMWDIAWHILPGERLRVDISSSDFPQYAAHSNRLGIWSLQTGTQPARQTVYLDGCKLILPVL